MSKLAVVEAPVEIRPPADENVGLISMEEAAQIRRLNELLAIHRDTATSVQGYLETVLVGILRARGIDPESGRFRIDETSGVIARLGD